MRVTSRVSLGLGLLLAQAMASRTGRHSPPARSAPFFMVHASEAPPAGSTTPGRTARASSEASPAAADGRARGMGAESADAPRERSGIVTPDGMLPVPGGTFVMGSDTGGEEDEHPAHRVTVRSFFLDRTEVTNRAYAVCVDAGRCRAPDPASAGRNHFGSDATFRGPEQPVSAVSWDDARAYCAFAGKRLPSEAEFERAARGDDQRTYPWGNDPPTRERAVFGTSCTANVAMHPAGAGPYGHLDLAGNVWEWIRDDYDPEAYRRPSADHGVPGTCGDILATQDALRRAGRRGFTGSNPIPKECEHVLRGGAFNYGGPGLRASNRVHHPGRFRLIMSGLRCAKDPG